MIEQALQDSQSGTVLNVVLRGPSLASDVQVVLNADNQYSTDLFLEEILQVLQSNDTSMTDDELEFIVTFLLKPPCQKTKQQLWVQRHVQSFVF